MKSHHESSATAESSNSPMITVRMVLLAFRRWWVIPLQILLAIASLGLLYFTFQPQYEATTLLRISSNAPFVVFRSREDSQQFVANQVELIQSDLVLGKLVSDPRIARLLTEAENPVEELRANVRVASVGDSDLFRITFTGYDPNDAAMVANQISKRYFELRGEHEAMRWQRVIDLLEDEKRSRELGVRELRDNVRALAKQQNVNVAFSPPSTGSVAIDDPSSTSRETLSLRAYPLDDVQRRIANCVVEQAVLNAQIKAFEEWDQSQQVVVSAATLDEAISQLPEIQELSARISSNQVLLQEYESLAKSAEDSPTYQQMQRQISRDVKALEELRGKLRPDVEQQLKASEISKRERELVNLKTQLETSQICQQVLQDQLDAQVAELKESNSDTLDLEFRMAELVRANHVLDMIEARSMELRTERRAPERVEELQAAVPPLAPLQKLPYKHMAVALMASLCLPLGMSLLIERQVQRISDATQLEENSKVAVVGEITNLPERRRSTSKSATIRLSRGLSLFEESVDILRTRLVLGEHKGLQVLAVTSACTREGKTSISCQLALSVARATGEKTLLIDGDMRSPDVHRLFDAPLEPGLVGVLDNQCRLEDAISVTFDENLFVLPAGQLQHSPHALLGGDAFDRLIEEARKTYRYVIVDTSPLLSCGESLVLAKSADITLLCAMRNVSRVKQVQLVYNRLRAANANPVGVVLNGVPAKQYVYSYGYYGYTR